MNQKSAGHSHGSLGKMFHAAEKQVFVGYFD